MKGNHVLRHEHYEQFKFHSIRVPLSDGAKVMVHFKRLPQAESGHHANDDSVYSQLHKHLNFKPAEGSKSSSQQMDAGEIPLSRSLVIICFDHPIDEAAMMKVFSLNGKVRRIFKGKFKVSSQELNSEVAIGTKNKQVYIGLVVYRNEFDLTKCFDLDFFQERIQKKFMLQKQNASGKEQYQTKLFAKYEPIDEEKNKWVEEAEKDGFEVVTDRHGDFNFEQPNEPKQHAARKRKTKKDEKNSLYKYELELKGMEEAIGENPKAKSAKDLLRMKKAELLSGFQQDKQMLQTLKKVKQG